MMKKIVCCHGDKGGVGKTVLATALIDIALAVGPVTLVEGDTKIADAAARYRGTQNLSGLLIDLARPDGSEDAAIRLFEAIEQAGSPETIIINLPASASSTIDAQADVIRAAADELGYDLRVAWLLGPGEESARLAATSDLCAVADRRIAVHNAVFGEVGRSAWTRHKAKTDWMASGGLETVLPTLAPRVMTSIRDLQGRYSVLTEPNSGLSVISRQIIKNWLRAVESGPGRLMLSDKLETDHE